MTNSAPYASDVHLFEMVDIYFSFWNGLTQRGKAAAKQALSTDFAPEK